jgi:2-dehydro-3-deoxyglucarate aldolase/4-hydroxy-2-oxoheptanedioate aldolase
LTETAYVSFRERLARREPLLGTLLTLPSPEIAELLAGAGFDWLFFDMEHGLLDFAAVQRMVQAVASSCPCLVRVPNNEPILIGKALDTGADGIIVPHVTTAAEAGAAVRAAKYPPAGARSIGVGRAQRYGRRLRESIAGDNEATLVVAQVEHVDAVPHIDEIVNVPGVSAVFIGPFDLSASFGKPGEIDAPEVRQAMSAFASACAARALACGLFLGGGEAARRAFDEGYSLVCAATDTLLLGEAAGRLRAAAAEGGGGARG